LKLVDRYITGEIVRAVLAGTVLFWAVLFCIYELNHLIKFFVRKGYPAEVVGKLFLLYIPQDVAWVLPIAVIFGVILAIGRLSGDGELVAMHAGGVSFRRMLLPVAFVGLLGVGALYVFSELLGPPGLSRAEDLVRRYGSPDVETSAFTYAARQDGKLVMCVVAARIDPPQRRLYGVTVIRYAGDRVLQVVAADSAVWEGARLVLERPRFAAGQIGGGARRATFEVEGVPMEFDETIRRPEQMTIAQMRARVAELYRIGADVRQEIRPIEQRIAVRRADPWCALGLALVSAPLGIRRVRTTAGVSIGLAVLVFVPYYFVSFTLQVIGKHGGISPEIVAWSANVLLFVIAAGLILDSSR
jgi:lipopolysaccharide export system permease protein